MIQWLRIWPHVRKGHIVRMTRVTKAMRDTSVGTLVTCSCQDQWAL